MLDPFDILCAMRGVGEAELIEAQNFIGYTGSSRRPRSRAAAGVKGITKRALLIAAVILLALGVVACTVYYTYWAPGLERRYSPTEDEKLAAEQSGLSMRPETENSEQETISATAGGVTITAQQAIVDNYGADISLRIEGYTVPEGYFPDTLPPDVTVGGERVQIYGGGFSEEPSNDGSLEYEISLLNAREPGFFIGKEIYIKIEGLGIGDKGRYDPVLNEVWELRWTLKGSDELRTVSLGTQIGNTGVSLEEAELSPISLRLVYKTEEIWTGFETLEPFPLRPLGFIMKDGTEYQTYLIPWREGYVDAENKLIEAYFSLDKILDASEVAAILFAEDPIPGQTPPESIYTVPLG